jgi:hypothetical protein
LQSRLRSLAWRIVNEALRFRLTSFGLWHQFVMGFARQRLFDWTLARRSSGEIGVAEESALARPELRFLFGASETQAALRACPKAAAA